MQQRVHGVRLLKLILVGLKLTIPPAQTDLLPFQRLLKVPFLGFQVVVFQSIHKGFKTKAEANAKLQELGYVTKTSLTKDVTILVNESGVESAKTKKARESGVEIITNLLDFIGE